MILNKFLSDSYKQGLTNNLNSLISYLLSDFNFYRDKLKNLGQTLLSNLNDLHQYPLLDKKDSKLSELINEVLKNNPPAYFETSGTSGNPFPVIPDLSKKSSNLFASFISEWLDLKKNNITKAIVALPFEMNPIGLKYFLALTQLNIMVIPVGVRTHLCPPRKVVELIERMRPELLIARPMETLRYLEIMDEIGSNSNQHSLKKVILTGEIISPAKFKRIKDKIKEVYSVYGLTELDSGGLATCKENNYHLPSKPYLHLELLEDDWKTPIKKTEKVGNIVITNTHKNYMPLLRYKTGDYGFAKPSCTCNQFETPVISLSGRSSDVIHQNGQKIFPIDIENIILSFDEVASDYLIVKKNDDYELRIEWRYQYNKSVVDNFIKNLKKIIRDKINLKIESIKIYKRGELINNCGIAKSKAGVLYHRDLYRNNEDLTLNYSCSDQL